ncbi:MAG: hypothetical protein INF16_13680 [Methylobacterium sp.]|nr:hypothetical protein [Methylobacterium sp.]
MARLLSRSSCTRGNVSSLEGQAQRIFDTLGKGKPAAAIDAEPCDPAGCDEDEHE